MVAVLAVFFAVSCAAGIACIGNVPGRMRLRCATRERFRASSNAWRSRNNAETPQISSPPPAFIGCSGRGGHARMRRRCLPWRAARAPMVRRLPCRFGDPAQRHDRSSAAVRHYCESTGFRCRQGCDVSARSASQNAGHGVVPQRSGRSCGIYCNAQIAQPPRRVAAKGGPGCRGLRMEFSAGVRARPIDAGAVRVRLSGAACGA